ncbi:MAG: hypothetical protein H7Y00_09870 [Fimbriimonadaceae bacterium]|nr:hypothetical protein [Chitinophagales bacterium]
MKKKLLFPVAVFLVIGLAACEQCTNCNYELDYNKYNSEGLLLESGTFKDAEAPKYCGKKGEVKDKETAYEESTDVFIDSLTAEGYEIAIVQSGCERE